MQLIQNALNMGASHTLPADVVRLLLNHTKKTTCSGELSSTTKGTRKKLTGTRKRKCSDGDAVADQRGGQGKDSVKKKVLKQLAPATKIIKTKRIVSSTSSSSIDSSTESSI